MVVVLQADDTHVLVIATIEDPHDKESPEQVRYREQLELSGPLA